MNKAAILIAGVVVIVGVNIWAGGRDRVVAQAALAYETCVKSEYHMTPIRWYEQHGEYPLCGN